MSEDGLKRFAKLETDIILGRASDEDIARYKEILALARGEQGGIIPLLRKAIEEDREMIKVFPVLMNDPERLADGTALVTEFDEDLYSIRRWGMNALLLILEHMLIGELS